MRLLNVFAMVALVATSFSPAQADVPADDFADTDAFARFMQTYYLDPRPDRIDAAMRYADASGLAASSNAVTPLRMGFSCLFSSADAARQAHWRQTIGELHEPARGVFASAMSTTPSDLLSLTPISGAKNDLDWGCFFATGNGSYVDDIVDRLKYVDEREDIALFLAGRTAEWSLACNIGPHPIVREKIQALRNSSDRRMKSVAEEILTTDPTAIDAETLAIAQAQHKKGVW